MKKITENIDITEDVIAYIVGRYDEVGVDRILISFKRIEKRGIQELYERMWKKYPYSAKPF